MPFVLLPVGVVLVAAMVSVALLIRATFSKRWPGVVLAFVGMNCIWVGTISVLWQLSLGLEDADWADADRVARTGLVVLAVSNSLAFGSFAILKLAMCSRGDGGSAIRNDDRQ